MCDCTIGLLSYGYNGSELVTLGALKDYIAESIYFNDTLVATYASAERANCLKRKIWQLSDYGDLRKSTNLKRFQHCPYCGAQIDWKAIRRMYDVKGRTLD